MKRFLTCLWLLASLGASWAQGPASITRFTLDNGMEVIVQPERRAPTAVHMLWVRVG